jgi:hypothetical protein
MDFAANVAFVNNCEGIPRLVGRQEPGKPCRRALFVFGSPLRSASFTGDLSIIEAGLVRGAAPAIHNVDHSRTQLVQCLG